MSTLDGLATALQSVVGEKYLLTDTVAAPYAVDDVLPSLVALPENEDQVADVLRLADEHDATVFPRGGGSHTPLGATPERVDVVLSVERLRRQLAYEPGDMTTTVQAGMPLEELQGVLGAQGQFVALDPPATAATTIGGVIATNASGPRRLLYGTARDVVLGVSVVTADGTRSKAGGRVVKNVTGYDLTKLYIGSLGTLGVLLELTFKVHPLPPGEETIGIACVDPADILPVLNALLRLPLRLNSLELLNAAAMASLQADSGVTMPPSPYLFMARLEGDAAVTASQKQRIAEALRGLPLGAAADRLDLQPEEQQRLWSSLAVQVFSSDSVVAKVGLRITDLAALCAEVEALAADPPWLLRAHAGNGIVSVQVPTGDGSEEALLAQIQALDACVARLNGHRVIERAPVAVKRRCEVWGPVGDNFAVMQALKASYDPRRRLNPGRFIGGL
jgi:glycolate oxidase FAD binding subunit